MRSIRFHDRARRVQSMRWSRSGPSCRLGGSSPGYQTDAHRVNPKAMRCTKIRVVQSSLLDVCKQVLAKSKQMFIDHDLLTWRAIAPHVVNAVYDSLNVATESRQDIDRSLCSGCRRSTLRSLRLRSRPRRSGVVLYTASRVSALPSTQARRAVRLRFRGVIADDLRKVLVCIEVCVQILVCRNTVEPADTARIEPRKGHTCKGVVAREWRCCRCYMADHRLKSFAYSWFPLS